MVDNEKNRKDFEYDEFIVEKNFWGMWQGRIIRTIVLHRVFSLDKIFEFSRLDKQAFDKAYSELLTRKFIEEKEDGRNFCCQTNLQAMYEFFCRTTNRTR